RVEAELSLESLREYRENFPAWQDADRFTLE
ncbi:amidohydrolase, partial [Leptospira borgpetersenii serovar Balcanica]|nr:amidohydrolase [Leptospira borgpetersenii serovar Balcanica]